MIQTRVLLLRHAETSAPDRFHGAESDIGLGPRGIRQAEAVAPILAAEQPAAVFTSAMRRALDTAWPIARACGLEPKAEPELHERRMGNLSGVSRDVGLAAYADAKRRWMEGDLEYTHEGGESFADIARRVVPVFRRIATGAAGTTIVVVAHGVVIRVLLISLLDTLTPADFERIAIDNTALNDLRHDGRSWTAASLNQRVTPVFDDFAW